MGGALATARTTGLGARVGGCFGSRSAGTAPVAASRSPAVLGARPEVLCCLVDLTADAPPPTTAVVLTGPYTLASAAGLDAGATTTLARRLHDELVALGEAGCALAVVDEPAATGIGAD